MKASDRYGAEVSLFPHPSTPLTLAQFAAMAWTPEKGERINLSDSYDGRPFSWLFQYRPDLDVTYPWHADTNALPLVDDHRVKDPVAINHDATWYEPFPNATIRVPKAGVWECQSSIWGYNIDGFARNPQRHGISVNDADPVAGAFDEVVGWNGSPANSQVEDLFTGNLTLAAADYVEPGYQSAVVGSQVMYFYDAIMRVRPVKIAA